MNICILADCEVTSKARGLCTSHYYKHKNAGTLDSVGLPLKQKASPPHTLSNIDEDSKTATCVFCGPLTKVYMAQSGNWACNTPRLEAATRYRKTREYQINHSEYFYGDGERVPAAFAKAERERFIEEQDNLCAICKQPTEQALALDHCHTTGKIRGLLCSRHNRGLGFFDDDPELLQAAIDYLTK